MQGARDYFTAIEYYATQLAIAQEFGYGEGMAHGHGARAWRTVASGLRISR